MSNEIQKIQPKPIVSQRQLPEGYALVRTDDLAKMQHRQPQYPAWRNAPDPVSVQANSQGALVLKWCGMGLAGCIGAAILINALKPVPQPPAPIIVPPVVTSPTPSSQSADRGCRSSCFSIF